MKKLLLFYQHYIISITIYILTDRISSLESELRSAKKDKEDKDAT